MLTRSRPQWPTLVLFFVGCLGFDYQVTIEPTIDPGSVGGDVSTVAGGFNRPGGSPGCYGNGRIYMSDTGNHVIKSVDRGSGAVNTEAGKKGVKGLVDGRGGDAAFYNPQGVAVGPDDTCACPPLVASRQRTTDKHARPRARLQCTSPTRSSTDPAHTMHTPCTCHAHAMHVFTIYSPARGGSVHCRHDEPRHPPHRRTVKMPRLAAAHMATHRSSSPPACSGRPPPWARDRREAAAALGDLPNVTDFARR